MTKKEMLDLMRLLSALESWSFSSGTSYLPDYLYENLTNSVESLERNILEDKP